LMNRKLQGAVETIFLMPKEEYTYLSSRLVKEIARLGGDVSKFVPAVVAKALASKFSGCDRRRIGELHKSSATMKVHLKQMPAQGLHVRGEEDCPLTELGADDVRCAGRLVYD